MKTEYFWMILGIVGLLSQLGGTFWKAYRRFFIPIITAGMLWTFEGHFYWSYIFIMLHLWGAFSLPITKFGNSIPNDWRNWLWVPLWAYVLCSPVLWLQFNLWPSALICASLLASLVVLSNLKPTAKWFQWKFVEFFEGVLPLIPICYAVTL